MLISWTFSVWKVSKCHCKLMQDFLHLGQISLRGFPSCKRFTWARKLNACLVLKLHWSHWKDLTLVCIFAICFLRALSFRTVFLHISQVAGRSRVLSSSGMLHWFLARCKFKSLTNFPHQGQLTPVFPVWRLLMCILTAPASELNSQWGHWIWGTDLSWTTLMWWLRSTNLLPQC